MLFRRIGWVAALALTMTCLWIYGNAPAEWGLAFAASSRGTSSSKGQPEHDLGAPAFSPTKGPKAALDHAIVWQPWVTLKPGVDGCQVSFREGGDDRLPEGPDHLAVDGLGQVILADPVGHRLLRFRPDGTCLGVLPLDGRVDNLAASGQSELVATTDALARTIAVVDETGKVAAQTTQDLVVSPLARWDGARFSHQDDVIPMQGQTGFPAHSLRTPNASDADRFLSFSRSGVPDRFRPLHHFIRWVSGQGLLLFSASWGTDASPKWASHRVWIPEPKAHGTHPLLGGVLVDLDQEGRWYVKLEFRQPAAEGVLSVGRELWVLGVDGKLESRVILPPLDDVRVPVHRELAVAPDGIVYWLQSLQDSSHIFRWVPPWVADEEGAEGAGQGGVPHE